MTRRPVLLIAAAVAAISSVFAQPAAAAPDGAAAAVVAAINAERSAAGLAPIPLDSGSSAQAAADIFAATGTAHTPEHAWTMPGGLRSREISASTAGSTGDAVRLWMGSPGHRWALLDESADRVRVGVACREDGRMFLVAQVRVETGAGSEPDAAPVTASNSGVRCPQPPPVTTPPTQPPATSPPATSPPTTAPTSPPPATTPPVSRPPATTPPTQPPATSPPATSPPVTAPPVDDPSASDPDAEADQPDPEANPDGESDGEELGPVSDDPSDLPPVPSEGSDVTITNGGGSGGGMGRWLLGAATVSFLGAAAGMAYLRRAQTDGDDEYWEGEPGHGDHEFMESDDGAYE